MIGLERVLRFHEGKSRKLVTKTKWIMREYRVNYQYLNVPSTRRTPDQPHLKLEDWVLRKINENERGTKGKSTDEKQDIPSNTFPDDHADHGGRPAIISSPAPLTTLLPINQVPPVPNNYDLSNHALNSSCQFDQYYSGQMISAFGEHDHHHQDPIAFANTRLHNYALADHPDPFFNVNMTRVPDDDHHVFAAPVPNYLANSAFDWSCDIDHQGRREDDDDRRGLQLSGPAFNDPPLGNPDINFGHTDDVLIFNDVRPSSGFAGELDQLLPMFDASGDAHQNSDLGSSTTAGDHMFSENKEPDDQHHDSDQCPDQKQPH